MGMADKTIKNQSLYKSFTVTPYPIEHLPPF